MKPAALYKIAAVLLVLFAVGHTLGFRKLDPDWKVDQAVAAMQTVHFTAQGFERTYYDFYVGFGLFVSAFLLFAALIAWQLAAVPVEILRRLAVLRWGLVLCFLAVTIFSWKYFFVVPVVLSGLVTICFILGTWMIGALNSSHE